MRSIMRLVVGAAVVLALAGCVASHLPTTVGPTGFETHVVRISEASLPRAWGVYYPLTEEIKYDTDCEAEEAAGRMVAAHEIGHALGLGHFPPRSIMQSWHTRAETCIVLLTEPEIATASRTARGKVFILALDGSVTPPVRSHVRWAVRLWNAALGRPVLRFANE